MPFLNTISWYFFVFSLWCPIRISWQNCIWPLLWISKKYFVYAWWYILTHIHHPYNAMLMTRMIKYMNFDCPYNKVGETGTMYKWIFFFSVILLGSLFEIGSPGTINALLGLSSFLDSSTDVYWFYHPKGWV